MQVDQKQISEMAGDMDYGCVKHDLWPEDAKEIAKALVILGYKKVGPEDIVISKCEYEILKTKPDCEFCEDFLAKQTAEKILKFLYENCIAVGNGILAINTSKLEDLATQFRINTEKETLNGKTNN